MEIHHHLHVVAQQRDQRLRRIAIRHDLEIDAGRRLEQLGAEILRAADIDGADIELARLLARGLDEILQRTERRAAFVARMRSKEPSSEIAAKSFTGSNGSDLNSATLTAVPLLARNSI